MFDEIGGGLWLYDLDRRSTTRLTDGSRLAAYAIFTRDGREAVFRSPTGIFRQPLEGSATPVLISGTEPSEFPSGLSPDGTEVFYTKISTGSAGDIRAISLAGGKPRVLMSTPAYEGGAQVSPDGKWMVYVSNELGEFEVFLQPYPALNRRIQVSSSGGVHAAWNPRGGEIFYRSTDKLMSVRMVTTAAGPVLSPPSVLLSGRYAFGGGFTTPNYTVSADGDTFILVKEQSGAILNIVLNWFEELKRTSAR
jgi:Tol biopolymer transport system component